MSRLKISNKKTTRIPLPEPNTSNTTTINPKILIQANNTKKEYINIKNAVKILETYSNWNGYIKLYTEVESNFDVGDTIYITYLELNDYPNVFRLDNSNVIYSTYNFGYKILYVDKNKNEIVINRYYNDITPGYKLKHQYLSKISCNGGIFYNDITDGVVFYNSNVFSSQFSTMSGHVSGVTESGTTVLSGATIEVSGLKAYTDINGYYILTVPIGQSIATCSATGYTTETVIPTILPNVNNTVDFVLMAPYKYYGADLYDCYCTLIEPGIFVKSIFSYSINKYYRHDNYVININAILSPVATDNILSGGTEYDTCPEVCTTYNNYIIDVYNCYCTNVASGIQAKSLNTLTVGKFYYLSETTIAEIISTGGDGSEAIIYTFIPYNSCAETGVECISITTTTTTTVPYYTYYLTASKLSLSGACGQYILTTERYASESSPLDITQFFENSGLTIAYNITGYYGWNTTFNDDSIYSGYISGGTVLSAQTCLIVSTTTTTT